MDPTSPDSPKNPNDLGTPEKVDAVFAGDDLREVNEGLVEPKKQLVTEKIVVDNKSNDEPLHDELMSEELPPEELNDKEPQVAEAEETQKIEEEDRSEEFKAQHTALKCLALMARHHGVDVSADRLIHDYSLENEEPSLRRVLRIAKDSGFKARHHRR